jgi:pyruvate carboxylase
VFAKVLVANRGEIAIRAFRAAYELSARTVAVFPYEDRNSEHRLKADEAYEIGERGHPVRAYLDPAGIVATAVRAEADAVYPGYGFLSENPDLAQACADAGITFVGPSVEVLKLTGNKARAIAAAREAGVPVLGSVEPGTDVDELVAATEGMTYPLFVKAVAGGGGRGMRRVDDPKRMRESVEAAMREADSAFGDRTVFIEQAVVSPRHIEVQILGDATGEVVHLFERDCSVQRRHQKVVEIAPAPHLDPDLRERLCADAVRFAKSIGYTCAGTVEFLVDPDGRHVFIEMNPRIQVEHTVTEEVTDVDLVQAQIRIAAGETLADLGLSQDTIAVRGAALQCRITTEDPANDFRPDTGRITTYRSPGGAGVRLDGGTTYTGAEVSAHFDSLLTKLTCRGRTFELAVERAQRAVAEFRIRGVSTNIPFLQSLLAHPDLQAGRITTSFIDDNPQLLTQNVSADRGTRLLSYLADVTVNLPHGKAPATLDPATKLPPVDLVSAPPDGTRQQLLELGPEGFAAALRTRTGVAVTDTTFRDAHQSLLATRVRTMDLLGAASHVARMTPQLWSVEAWGGATYDVALRFLKEDPWERLAQLREQLPNICLQMLLRGRNTVGYTPYPEEVTRAFVEEATSTGIDVFRIFDALNDVEQMRPAIEAVRETGRSVAEVALCYTGDLSDPDEWLYTLDYYLGLAERIVDAGAHVIAIKDMAGLLRAPAARTLVTALRERFDLPVHLHTHDTPGGQLASLMAAIDAGVDAVDAASASLAGTTSQPAMSALVAATLGTARGDRPGPARRVRPRALLGGGALDVRAVRVGPAQSHRAGLHARDPRRPAVQPAPAGPVPGPRREVRADRGHVRRGQRHPRQHREGDADQQGRRRPRPAPGRGRRGPGRVRGRARPLRRPGLGRRLPVRRARRPARRLAGAVPDQGAGRAIHASGRHRAHRRRPRGPGGRHSRTLNRLLFPGPTSEYEQSRSDHSDLSCCRRAASSTASTPTPTPRFGSRRARR